MVNLDVLHCDVESAGPWDALKMLNQRPGDALKLKQCGEGKLQQKGNKVLTDEHH